VNLTKRYGPRAVVDHVGLQVRRGEVYGFLGPNGAGKTTTLRLLLGLVRPSSGTARMLGAAPGAPAALARIGMLIEAPAFYPYSSGRDNLDRLDDHRDAQSASDRRSDAKASKSCGGPPNQTEVSGRLRRVAHSRSASILRGTGRAVPGMMSGDSGGSVR
jgi:ABC-type multidrug transport system ATPase subunit